MDSTKEGTVKFFNKEKGYGFIKGGDGKDVFIHVSNIYYEEDEFNEGDVVTYKERTGKKGQEAFDAMLKEY